MLEGDRVKFSGYRLKSLRDYWLGQGHEPMKSAAKRNYDEAAAARGTVIGVRVGTFTPKIVTVKMDDGALHDSLPDRFEVVDSVNRSSEGRKQTA